MQIKTWKLLIVLGLASSFSAAESVIRTSEPLRPIAPLVAQAYTSRVNITLERQPNESFQTLTRRAETVARAAAQRSFDNDILVTQAAVIVTAENGGLSAPILSLEVSRDNWKNYPNAQRWSTYYPTAQALLRIENPVPTAVETPPAGSTNPTNSSGTGTSTPTGTTSTTPNLTPGITPANQTRQNSGTNPANATGGGTTGTSSTNQRSNPTNRTGNTRNTQRSNSSTTGNNTQQDNSTTPANRTGTNNNQTGVLSSPNQQTNTQPNRPRSRATYGEGLIRRTRELRDEINNRPATDLPQD